MNNMKDKLQTTQDINVSSSISTKVIEFVN